MVLEMNEIANLLKEKGLTQHVMAKQLGVVQGLVGGWARGDKQVSVEMALKIEQEFKVPCEKFSPILEAAVQLAFERERMKKKAKGRKAS